MLRQTISSRPKSERLVVFAFITLACLTVAQAIYYGYATYYAEITGDHHGVTQEQYYRQHNTVALSTDHPFFSGRDHAPGQYRVGIEVPVKFVASALRITRLYQIFAALDFVTGVAACTLAYSLLCGSAFFQRLDGSAKRITVALLLATLAYPLFWAIPWVRPETLPSALYLASVLCLVKRLHVKPIWLGAIVLATIWQGFIRADVAAVLGIAVTLFASSSSAKLLFGSRKLAFATGLSILAVAVGVQALLQLILFPHATYSTDGPVVQLFLNFHARKLITFVIALLPYAFILSLAARFRKQLEPLDMLALLASCLYLALWVTVGIVIEVRIFVPFLLILTPAAAKLLLPLLIGTENTMEGLSQQEDRYAPGN